jgi:hypothetical protein
MIRDLFPTNEKLIAAALVCEQEGTKEAAQALRNAAYAAYAAYAADAADAAASAASDAAYAAYAASAASDAAASAASDAAYAAAAYAASDAAQRIKNADPDKYLFLEASLALEVLRELKSPGCALLGVK